MKNVNVMDNTRPIKIMCKKFAGKPKISKINGLFQCDFKYAKAGTKDAKHLNPDCEYNPFVELKKRYTEDHINKACRDAEVSCSMLIKEITYQIELMKAIKKEVSIKPAINNDENTQRLLKKKEDNLKRRLMEVDELTTKLKAYMSQLKELDKILEYYAKSCESCLNAKLNVYYRAYAASLEAGSNFKPSEVKVDMSVFEDFIITHKGIYEDIEAAIETEFDMTEFFYVAEGSDSETSSIAEAGTTESESVDDEERGDIYAV